VPVLVHEHVRILVLTFLISFDIQEKEQERELVVIQAVTS
jgi:hypothetical protein